MDVGWAAAVGALIGSFVTGALAYLGPLRVQRRQEGSELAIRVEDRHDEAISAVAEVSRSCWVLVGHLETTLDKRLRGQPVSLDAFDEGVRIGREEFQRTVSKLLVHGFDEFRGQLVHELDEAVRAIGEAVQDPTTDTAERLIAIGPFEKVYFAPRREQARWIWEIDTQYPPTLTRRALRQPVIPPWRRRRS
ncbi:hypothetical protein ACWDG9_16645 [Streptomyces sp. NPDC001073]